MTPRIPVTPLHCGSRMFTLGTVQATTNGVRITSDLCVCQTCGMRQGVPREYRAATAGEIFKQEMGR